MAEKQKKTGAARKPASAGSKPAGAQKKQSGDKPASKKPAGAGKRPDGAQKKRSGDTSAPGKPSSSGPKPAGAGKPSGGKPATPKPSGGDRPAPKKPAGAGKKPSGAGKASDGKPATRKPSGGDRPIPKKPAGAGKKPSGAGKASGGKPSTRKPSGGDRPAPKKPAGAAKKGEGAARSRSTDERKKAAWDKPERRPAKPRKPTPRKGSDTTPKRLPKEAALAGVQPQPKPVKRPGVKARRPEPGEVRAAMRSVAAWLHAKKALDIMALDVSGLCSVAEGLVLATARNVRQAQALADHVLKTAGEQGMSYLGLEGYRAGAWVLLDLNDVLVHIFLDESRRFYNLEGLWADAPVLELDLGPAGDREEDADV